MMDALPRLVNWADPRTARPWQRTALASQNKIDPRRSGPANRTSAVRVTGVPRSTSDAERCNSVVLGTAIASTARAEEGRNAKRTTTANNIFVRDMLLISVPKKFARCVVPGDAGELSVIQVRGGARHCPKGIRN